MIDLTPLSLPFLHCFFPLLLLCVSNSISVQLQNVEDVPAVLPLEFVPAVSYHWKAVHNVQLEDGIPVPLETAPKPLHDM